MKKNLPMKSGSKKVFFQSTPSRFENLMVRPAYVEMTGQLIILIMRYVQQSKHDDCMEIN
jgi:hypothetical protein